jgi:hypothetical protein
LPYKNGKNIWQGQPLWKIQKSVANNGTPPEPSLLIADPESVEVPIG